MQSIWPMPPRRSRRAQPGGPSVHHRRPDRAHGSFYARSRSDRIGRRHRRQPARRDQRRDQRDPHHVSGLRQAGHRRQRPGRGGSVQRDRRRETTHLNDFQTALNAVTNPASGAKCRSAIINTGADHGGPPKSQGATLENLRTAKQGEAFAYAKYMRYADQARRDGNTAVAQLFTNTANVELNEHFAALANLAGLVSPDTNANLTDAINGEQHEADVMYPDYARQADQAGNTQAANLFREIAGDEKSHQQDFQKALTAS